MERTDIAAHAARIEADGYTIVEDVFDATRADALLADLDRLQAELGVGPHKNLFEGRNTIRIYNLLARGALYEAIAVDDHVLPVVERILDDGCLVSSLSSISILPGEVAQPIHADDQLIPVPKPHVPFVCNSMWALTDFTDENGATRIIPGSHKRDHSPAFGQHYDSQPATMKRGSVMIYDGAMWHGGGANGSGERRVGIAMNYCAGYIRQQENQQLGIPRDVARGFSPRLRELVGYSVYRNLIGHIDHGHPGRILE
jgi:ectoine hydroxylase-related dioxygenase (phytanoyl-CoA dioxygenase family)